MNKDAAPNMYDAFALGIVVGVLIGIAVSCAFFFTAIAKVCQ